MTDVELPRALFSSWHEAGKARQIRRPLMEVEREALERRRDELAPALAPFRGDDERDIVALALLDLYNGFASIRGDEAASAARVDSAMMVVSAHPAWAIHKACMSIRTKGVYREVRGAMKYDRQWPPNEAEIVEAVKQEERLYRDQYEICVALLTATVEER